MPTVPRYDNLQVTPGTLPQVRLAMPDMPDIAGKQAQQLGQGMTQMGNALADMAVAQAQTEARDADTAFMSDLSALKTNYMSQQGKNAVDAFQPATDAVTELRQKHLDALSSPLARQEASRVFAHRAQSVVESMGTHRAGQELKWTSTSLESHAENSIQDAAANYSDPRAFSLSLGSALNDADSLGRLMGEDGGTTAARRRKYADDAFRLRYKAWQQDDAAVALGDFQKNAGQISPLVRDQIGDELFAAAAPQLAGQLNRMGGTGVVEARQPGSTAEPRGVRNNNPGNVMKGGKGWQGEVQGDDPRYASFATPEAGIRAMGKTLLTYQDKHGINTVEGLISRWAPATENNTAAYVATVAKAAGVKPDAALDLREGDTLGKLTRAMIQVENGKQPYSDQQIAAGIGAALGTAQLPPASVPAGGDQTTAVNWRDPAIQTGHPVVDALPIDKKMRVLQLAHTQANQDLAQVRESLHSRVQDSVAEYMARGAASNPPTEPEFIRAYGQVDGVKQYRQLQDTATLGLEIQRTKIASNADLSKMLVDAKPQAGEGFAARQRNYEILQRAVQHTVEQRKKDPVAYALENQAYGIKPLSGFGNPQTMAQELGKRYDAMNRIAADYGTRPFVMTDPEADAFGQYLGGLQAPDKARVLGQVFGAVGAAGVQSLSGQLKDKHNTLAVAAMLSTQQTTKGNSAALLYLQGKEAIEQKRAKIDDAAEIGIKAEIFKAIEGVYQTPQGRDAAAEAALGIYAKFKADGGGDVEQAIRIATGGVMDFNGGRIAKPYGWEDSRFRDALRGPVAQAVAGSGGEFLVGSNKVKAADFAKMLPGARLQTFGQGSYLVMAGNDVVREANGRPYVLKVAP